MVVVFILFLATVASALDMWQDCNFDSSTFEVTAGAEYFATGCNFPATKTLITLRQISSTASTTNVTVTNGFVLEGSDSALFIEGLSALQYNFTSNGPNQFSPFHFVIRNMSFGRDAILAVTNALPPLSSLVITNNSFTIENKNQFALLMLTYSIASAISISGTNGTFGFFLGLSTGSSITVANCSFILNAPRYSDTYAAGVFLAANAIEVNGYSSLILQNNSVNYTDPYVQVQVVMWAAGEDASLRITNESRVAMSGNSISYGWPETYPSISAQVIVVNWLHSNVASKAKIDDHSVLEVSGNRIHGGTLLTVGSGTTTYWSASTAIIDVTRSSSLSFNDNGVSGGADGPVIAVQWLSSSFTNISVCGSSHFSLSNNFVRNASRGAISYTVVVATDFQLTINILNRSDINVNNNSFTDSSTSSMLAVRFRASMGINVSVVDSSHIMIANNSITSSKIIDGNARTVSFNTALANGRMFVSIVGQSNMTITNNKLCNISVSNSSVTVHLYSRSQWYLYISNISMFAVKQNSISNSFAGAASGTIEVNAELGLWSADASLGSMIDFSGNRIDNVSTVDSDLKCVNFVSGSHMSLTASHRSFLLIDENAIVRTGSLLSLATVILDCKNASIAATGSSHVSASRNALLWSTSVTLIMSMGLQATRLTMNVSCNSTVAVESNQISGSSSTDSTTGMYTVFWTFASGDVMFTVTEQSSVLFTRNSLINSTFSGIVGVVYISQIAAFVIVAANCSRLHFDGNEMSDITTSRTSSSLAAASYFFSKDTSLFITENSTISWSYNRIANMVTPQIVVYTLRVQTAKLNAAVSFNSLMTKVGNEIQSVASRTAYVIYQTTSSIVQLNTTQNSYLVVNSNRLSGSSSTTTTYAVYWTAGETDVFANDGSEISFSDNSIWNSSSTSKLVVVHWNLQLFALVNNNSALSFQRNSAMSSGADNTITAVLLTSRFGISITTTNNSVMSLANNPISQCSSAQSLLVVSFETPFLNISLLASGNSSISLDGNSIMYSIAVTSARIIGFVAMGDVRMVIELQSNLTVSHNTVVYTTAVNYGIEVLHHNSTGRLAVNDHSSLMVEDNYIAHSVANGGSIYVLFWGSGSKALAYELLIGSQSVLSLSMNSILNSTAEDIVACLSIWILSDKPTESVRVAEGSAMMVSRNRLTEVSALNQISTVAISVIGGSPLFIVSQSSIVIQNNSLTNCSSNLTSTALFTIELITCSQESQLTIQNNTVALIEQVVSTVSVMIIRGKATFSSESALSVSYNSMTGSTHRSASPVDTAGILFLQRVSSVEITLQVFIASYVEIRGNLLSVSASSVYLVQCMQMVTIYSASSLIIRNNELKLTATSASPLNFTSDIRLQKGSIDISLNAFTLMPSSSEQSSTAVAYFACLPSVFWFENILQQVGAATNSLQITNNNISFGIAGDIDCPWLTVQSSRLESGLRIAQNKFTSPDPLYVSAGNLNLLSTGVLAFEDNVFIVNVSYLPPFALIKITLALTFQGALPQVVLRQNVITSSTTSPMNFPNFLFLNVTRDLTISNHSSMLLCGNSLFGAEASSYWPSLYVSPVRIATLLTPCEEKTASKTYSETLFERPSQTLYYNGTTPPPEKHIPVAVAAAKKVTTAVGIAVAVTAVASVAGGQLGVANAILRIANCQDANDDDEALPILMHPLQFSFGSDNYEKYAAGAISNTLIVPLIVAAIALVPARLLIMNVKGVTSATAMEQIGWPSVLILPFSNLAEGIGVTVLTSFISGETLGIGAALIATSLLLAFTGSWAWILIRVVPNTKMVLQKEEQNFSRKKPFLWRIVRPTHRWVPRGRVADEVIFERSLSEGFVEKYINAIGDKQWFYAEFVSFLCSIAVGITESLPSSICKERAIIALVPAFVQCGLSVLSLTPLERVLQSLLTLCLVPMYLVATVKVFNGDPDDDSLDSTLAVFSSAGNAIGIGIMSFGLAVGMWDIATTHRAKMARARRPSRKGRGTRSADQAGPPDITIPSLTGADTDSDDNLDVSMLPLDETNSQEDSAISQNQGYRSRQSRPSEEAAPANPQVHAPIATHSPRTVEDILDFVERAAIQQRIDQTIQHNNNNAFEL